MNIKILGLILAITCVSLVQAQSVYFDSRIPHNQKENFEVMKTGILEKIANDKQYTNDKERIRYAETTAFSEIMKNTDYVDKNGKKVKMKHANDGKLERAMSHLFLFAVKVVS